MSGLIAVVYGRRKLDDAMLDAVDGVLATVSASLIRTRKGRVWDCHIDGRVVHVSIEATAEVLWGCEDDLLKLDLLPEQVPICVVLSTPMRSSEDRHILDSLVHRILPATDGVVSTCD